ncbi:DUF1223 domain-containing protein [Microvirga brassicacearum]|uniref:DUF1223 domain-containing protein n=1 Tax=Microvirga brassicacearum TaxID=2580413 RepID=A0A5N3P9N6_9HYPH|nr:DUF1223 domain-containing protein [Microvirga brassicacearum]KAB0266462.1 DUF1223 domain-containing protein [Microvirga brassicacearum]
MVSRLTLSVAALGLALFSRPALAEPPRAVLELFTSQGCSSCPPADAVLADLARQPGIVALSFPVDYWDYLGWKDTLAHATFTARQKAYAQSRSDRQVYTPQIIVNGTKPCIGSDRARVEASIKATTNGGLLPVDMDISEANGTVTIAVKDTPQTITRVAEIWVLPVSRSQTVQIGRGENRGRTVTYANVVRGMNRIGEWRGGAARYQLPLEAARGKGDGYVVLLQTVEENAPSAILGAAKSKNL